MSAHSAAYICNTVAYNTLHQEEKKKQAEVKPRLGINFEHKSFGKREDAVGG
jgi:hypothetical protein